MNRKFVLPAAIALAFHALIFVGSGKPPTPEGTRRIRIKDPNPPVPPEEVVVQTVLESVKEEVTPSTNPEEKPGGGSTEDPPPGVPDIPRPEGPADRWTMTPEPVCDIYGKRDKLPTTSLRGFGYGDGNGPGSSIVGAAFLDDQPRTRYQKEPIYPPAMKVAGNSGTVWVEFVVDENGRVHDVRVVKSTNPGFDEATINAVSMWRFESGKRKGIPVRFRMSIPIVFNLNE